ncbi:MAG: hypothetical protein R3343_06475 [Nitriliruptorales bacterium]|nr:hypothetical protein [Nitriliruptorales bacterium]
MRGLILLGVLALALTATVLVTGDDPSGTTSGPPGSAAGSPTPDATPTRARTVGAITVTLLDDDFNSGLYTDVVTDARGLPVVSYYDDSVSDLFVIRCRDRACRDRTTANVAGTGHTGLSTSIALHGDLPVVSYYDLSRRAVRLARCLDPSCDEVQTTLIDDDVPELGDTALGITPEGRPVVAYRARSQGLLRLASCDDPGCSSVATSDLDGGGIGDTIDLRWSDGLLHVAYQRHEELRLLTCPLPCSDVEPIVLDSGPQAGFYPSVEVDPSGVPVVAHLDFDSKRVEVFACGTPSCGDPSMGIADQGPLSGFFTSLHLAADGRLWVAFYDEGLPGLVLVTCGTVHCRAPVRHVIDATPFAGQHLAFTVADQSPLLVYHDGSSRQMRLARCSTATCDAPPETTTPGEGIDLALTADGAPVVVFRRSERGGVRLLRCLDADCTEANATAADDVVTSSGSPSVTTTPDGDPVVAFQDLASEDLRLSRCRSARCPFLTGESVRVEGSVGHSPVALWSDGLHLVHRDETSGRIELLSCAAPHCRRPTSTVVTATAAVGGAVAAAVQPGGDIVVLYHDDRTGELHLRTCTRLDCGDAVTLAASSLPAPLGLAVTEERVAAVHRSAPSGGLEVLRCELPCSSPTVTELPDGAFPALAWHDGGLAVVHTLEDRTVLRTCGRSGTTCGGAVTVLAVAGPTAVTTEDGQVTVAVLTDEGPLLARCRGTSCRQLQPSIAPLR